ACGAVGRRGARLARPSRARARSDPRRLPGSERIRGLCLWIGEDGRSGRTGLSRAGPERRSLHFRRILAIGAFRTFEIRRFLMRARMLGQPTAALSIDQKSTSMLNFNVWSAVLLLSPSSKPSPIDKLTPFSFSEVGDDGADPAVAC